MQEPSEYLDRQKVAELLGVNVRTVDNMRKRGQLRAAKFGNNVRFLPATIAAFQSSLEAEAAKSANAVLTAGA